MKTQQRTLEQIIEHYEIEKKLAARLRNSTRQERQTLYKSIYNELFISVPHHPQLARKVSLQESEKKVDYEMRFLQPFLKSDSIFLEVGPGDCALSFRVSNFVKEVYAIDVSDEIFKNLDPCPNVTLILSNGTDIPVPLNSVDLAYSNNLIEHIHPDDTMEQLDNIYKVLAPGGVYICITPNRLTGPHDVSRDFDTIATGFHLKEYTVTELQHMFRKVGFSRIRVYLQIRKFSISIPVFYSMFCEKTLSALPISLRKLIASVRPVTWLLGIKLVGVK